MKIAVSATGPQPTDEVDPRFGRAPWFLIYDTETRASQPVSNQENVSSTHGAGVQTAQSMARLGVAGVITGHVGPKAYQVLSAANVRVYRGDARRVEEAVRVFERGQLRELTEANGPEGFGG
jgi:predicted Fe-Mo cluster-binding NifX family protein